MSKITTKARVRVTLEIDLDDRWGADCSLAQVFRQGEDGVRTVLMQHFVLDGMRIGDHADKAVRVVGKPQILAITSDGETP